jgi:hypothetical protein
MSRKQLKAVMTDAETDEFSPVTLRTSRGRLNGRAPPRLFLYCCGAAGLLTASCRTSRLATCAPPLTPLHPACRSLSI